MDAIQTGIVTLLKSAITGNKLYLPEDFDMDVAYPLIKKHHITSLAYAGALNCGIDQNKPAMQQLFQSYLRAVQVSRRQMRELNRVFAAFDEAGIAYLPVKGSVMRSFYPQPELRLMGDADVLIHIEQYDRIVPIMKALGFVEKGGADIHYVWESEQLNLELHKQLIDSDMAKCSDYFQDAWMFAGKEQGMRYAMDDVNTFAFLFAHFVKHYALSGIGCRHVVDLWVYLCSHPQMDQACLKAVLEKMDLWRFYQNIRKLIAVWFEGDESDEKTEFISKTIFHNGSWGSMADCIVSNGIRDRGKSESVTVSRIKYVWCRLFPSAERLTSEYPVLRKRPWLMPVVWCWRLLEKIITKRADPRRHMERLLLLNRQELDERKAMLEYVGLRDNE